MAQGWQSCCNTLDGHRDWNQKDLDLDPVSLLYEPYGVGELVTIMVS